MRFVTYRASVERAARLGFVEGDTVVDAEAFGRAFDMPLPATMLDFIDLGPAAVHALTSLVRETSGQCRTGISSPSANVELLATIPRPRKNVFGVGLNYVEHVAESSRALDTAKDFPKQLSFSRSSPPPSLDPT